MKSDWRKLNDRIERGSGLSPMNEPKWYKILNETFTETHEDLSVSAGAKDLSFNLNEESDLNTSSSEGNGENRSKSAQVNAE